MSLRVWLPLTKDLRNQGLSDVTVTNNGATYSATGGKLGGCYSFNGSSYITVQDVVLQNIWSYSCWLYSDISSRSWEVVMTCNINGGDADMQLGLYTRPGANIIQNTANGQYNASIPMTYGQWNHFVGTFDGVNLKTYLNGVLVNTKAITNAKLDRPKLTIGARCRGSSYDCYFQGLLNDIRIYDHCLSPMEVKQISQGLVLHYPLSGIGGENLVSQSTFGRSYGGDVYAPSTGLTIDGYKFVVTGNPSDSIGAKATNIKSTKITISAKTTYTGSGRSIYRKWFDSTGTQVGTYTSEKVTIENGKLLTTLNVPDGATSITFGLCYPYNQPYELWDLKVEEGDKHTPWCPNSTDELYHTMGLDDNIEYDCSGFGNNGTRVGDFTYSSDSSRYLTSTFFEQGVNSYIVTPTINFDGKGFTASYWFKSSSTGKSGYQMPLSTGGNYEMSISPDGKLRGGIYVNGTRYVYNAGTSNYLDGKWHMFTMTYNGEMICRYVDGVLKHSETISGTATTSNVFAIGRHGASNTTYGSINLYESDVRIYATALSADDVKSLYQNSAYIDNNGNVYGAIHTEV